MVIRSLSCVLLIMLCIKGHTDVVMGAAILKDDHLAERLRFLQNGNYAAFVVIYLDLFN